LTGTVRTIEADAGKTVVIVGPASFELLEGEATILGAPLDSLRHLVTRGKQTPVEMRSASSLRIRLGQDARVESVDGSTIPVSWREAAASLAELGEGTAVIIGDADSGKTTICTFLSNLLTLQGMRVAIVDADIGQTDMGPPTTMAAGIAARPVLSLSQVEASERLFIGLTSPSRVEEKVIRGVARLVGRHAEPGTLVMVNTDGWVTGADAVTYKLRMIDRLQPDLTLGIGTDADVSAVLQAGKRVSLLVGSPDLIRERTRVDRRELRTLGYQRYLAAASLKNFRVNGVRLRSGLTSQPIDPARLLRSGANDLIDRIVGFLNSDGFLSEIGVLREAVPSARTVKVWSRFDGKPDSIEVGEVRLNGQGRELSHAGR